MTVCPGCGMDLDARRPEEPRGDGGVGCLLASFGIAFGALAAIRVYHLAGDGWSVVAVSALLSIGALVVAVSSK